jgi:hypothetical protein
VLDPRLITAVRAWVMARCPEFEGRVQPLAAPPSDVPPFCVYHGTHHEHLVTLKELTGVVKARLLLIVWHTSHLEACRIGLKLVGTKADPGLHGRGQPLAFPTLFASTPNEVEAGIVAVQRCIFLPDSAQRDVPPRDGSEQHWYAVPLEFEIVYSAG